MPYSPGTRLPGESASKLGHLNVVSSDWVRSLVQEFDSPRTTDSDASNTIWADVDGTDVVPLRNVWAVDGSLASVQTETKPTRELSFVKTALLTVDRTRLATIDKDQPHPLLLQDVLTGSAVFHATVFPLKNIRTTLGSNYDAVRHIVRDSMKVDENGAFYETLKWLSYQKWNQSGAESPSFECPHCAQKIEPGLPHDADSGPCPHCEKDVFLTDMLGFHLDMDENSAPESVASSYMLMMEHLMLFTAVRLLWQHTDRQLLSDTLFIKDGPLTLRSQYSKLVPAIRAFLQTAKMKRRPVHIIGQEKTGAFVDHLASIVRFAPPQERGDPPHYSVLTHEYVRREVYRSPDLSNPYGMRTNWGEKLYLKLDPATYMVLNVPTGSYNPANDFPQASDLIGLPRILATIPSIVSHKFEGALFPIELANGIASLSSYPSARILQRFAEGSMA
jgi:hypothetical protein